MKEDVNDIKVALRVIEAKYVSSKISDNYAEIRFTYKNQNYILHINSEHKIMVLELIDSCIKKEIKDNTLGLLEDIRTIKSYMEFETYQVFAILTDMKTDEYSTTKRLQVTIGKDEDVVFHYETSNYEEEKEIKSSIIPYTSLLDTFDKRIFNEDWLEDFNEKVSTYCEEDLYIMLSTLMSYFNKVVNDTWKDYNVDIFVINYAMEVILEEISKRNININEWFSNLFNYFDKDTLEKYLNDKSKRKKLR